MEFKELCELIEAAGYSVRSYSGRGMNGKVCLGIDTDNTAMTLVLDLIKEALGSVNTSCGDRAYESIGEVQDLCDMLKNSRSDSMGRGYIVYFPEIKWIEPECKDCEISSGYCPKCGLDDGTR